MSLDIEKEKRIKLIEAKAIQFAKGKQTKEDCFVKKYLKKLHEAKKT